MPKREEGEFVLPHLILCEGPEDVSFFRALITDRNLPDCHIRHSGKDRHERGGNSQFAERLVGFRTERTYRHVKKVLIVTDSDHSAADRFAYIQQQLRSFHLPTPATPMTEEAGNPSITVLMMPHGVPGNLECVCQEAARAANPAIAALVDKFVADVADHTWPPEKRGKLWLRASVAARWVKDPCINFAPMFQGGQSRRLVPLEHQSFNPIAGHLQAFLV